MLYIDRSAAAAMIFPLDRGHGLDRLGPEASSLPRLTVDVPPLSFSSLSFLFILVNIVADAEHLHLSAGASLSALRASPPRRRGHRRAVSIR